ncbi:DnaJ C-terminal domain-containing protein [Mycoplasmopsis lipofaciens]|uniref:DnaJ C-terminal domain-containing protein n=1 Tax=Mycoplasmopsis lipofaciens TaxID=114884 RepID=UPI000482714B|nr:DnaJ C-terminal domain-containing protein [Mycoplasmopsis lipofaciens]
MASKKNYYEVLGINKNATEREIKAAYRKLAMKYHPDVYKGTDGDQKMQELNEAYEVLRDSTKRSNYDKYGSAEGPRMGGFEDVGAGMGGFADFFNNDIFGSMFNFGGSQRQQNANKKRRGEDLISEILVNFDDAIQGKKFTEELVKYELCDNCNGNGAESIQDIETCSTCHGSGQVASVTRTPLGNIKSMSYCPKCRGKGKTIKNVCHKCHGDLYERKIKKVTFKIPDGAQTGDKIRIDGYGEKGLNGGVSGDLYIIIKVKPHKFFKRDNLDLYLDFPVSFLDIIKENIVIVPTPYGSEKIRLKKSYQNGKILNLSNKGIKSKKGVGNLKIKLEIVIPELKTKQINEMAKLLDNFSDDTNLNFVKQFKK